METTWPGSNTPADQPPPAEYKTQDPEGHPPGKYTLRTIVKDSDHGRAYDQLTTDADRLAYMREHAHRSWNVVQTDTAFLEDRAAGKEYEIKKNTPAYEGLKQLKRDLGGASLAPGTKEYGALIQYFREHATNVKDLPTEEST